MEQREQTVRQDVKPRRLGRKLFRLAVVALPLTFFAFAVGVLSVIPALIERGSFNGLIEDRLGAALGTRVTVRRIRVVDCRQLVLEDVHVGPMRQVAEGLDIAAVTASFAFPFPLGTLRNVRVEQPHLYLDAGETKLSDLLNAPPGKPAPSAPVSLHGQVNIPDLEIIDGIVEGTFVDAPFRIAHLNGHLENKGGYLLPFYLAGHVENHPNPDVIIKGNLSLSDSEGKITFDRLKVGDLDSDLVLNSGQENRATFKLKEFAVSQSISKLLQDLAGGPQMAGIVTLNTTVSFRPDWKVARFGFEADLHHYTIQHPKVRSEQQEQTTHLSLTVSPIGEALHIEGTIQAVHVMLPDGPHLDAGELSFDATYAESTGLIHGRAEYQKARLVAGVIKISELKSGSFDFNLTAAKGTCQGTVTAALNGAFYEQGDAFLDLTDQTIAVKVEGGLVIDPVKIELKESSVSLNGLGVVAVSGEFHKDQDRYDYDLTVSTESLYAPALAKLGGDALSTFAGFDPEELTADGHVSGRAHFSATEAGSIVEGRVAFKNFDGRYHGLVLSKLNGELQIAAQSEATWTRNEFRLKFTSDALQAGSFTLKGASGDLPLLVMRGGIDSSTVLSGHLTMGRLLVHDIDFGPQQLPFETRANEIQALHPLTAEVLGGHVVLGRITLHGLAGPDFNAESSLDITGVQLAQVFEQLGSDKRPQGILEARFPRVEYAHRDVTFVGSARLLAFDGSATLSNIRLRKVATELMDYGFSVALDQLHLKSLLEAVVGQSLVHGVISGNASAVLFNTGAPVEFELMLWNVETGTQSQIVSLSAAKALIQAMEGEGAAASLDRLPIKRLYYSKLGVYSRLDPGGRFLLRGRHYHDRFNDASDAFHDYTWDELRGNTVVPNVDEYVVVGSHLHRINIINVRPGAKIPWSQFVDSWSHMELKQGSDPDR